MESLMHLWKHLFLGIVCIFLFLLGYFPTGDLHYHDTGSIVLGPAAAPTIDRIVLIVIDALRADFISETSTPFMYKLAQGNGCITKVKVETPTVTLPRIKALTTGMVPQFIDILFNLGDTYSVQDSILHKAKEKNKTAIFYGDDTWIKLYPNMFKRSEGVSSFYVNDFYEVDNNVTRNIDYELGMTDWDIMILHYLGLDHIGHVFGPFSTLIPPKLKEIDEVIRNISQRLLKDNKTMILVTGDHGMKDSGGHGGSTHAEVHVPLVVLGKPCYADAVNQIDIPVALSIRLGLDLPSQSIGQVRRSLLPDLPLGEYLEWLNFNLLKLNEKSSHRIDITESSLREAYLQSDTIGDEARRRLEKYQDEVNQVLIKNSVRKSTSLLILSIALTIYSLIDLSVSKSGYQLVVIVIGFCTKLLSFIYINSIFTITAVFVNFSGCKQKQLTGRNFLNFLIFLQPVTYFSSSFVEEEHLCWYYALAACGFLILVSQKERRRAWGQIIAICALWRFSMSLNTTGDKWASLPDVADFLMRNDHKLYLNCLILLNFVSIWFYFRETFKEFAGRCLSSTILILLGFIKLCNIAEPLVIHVIYLLILLHFILYKNVALSWVFIVALLIKPHNLILIPVCLFSSRILMKEDFKISSHFLLCKALYFMQGHSNSLANIDLSVGYLGLETYTPFVVFLQILCHSYAFPVLCDILILVRTKSENDVITFWKFSYLYRFTSLLFTCIVCVIHSQHLFVWSVFAPKLIIESCHGVFLFLEFLIFMTGRCLSRRHSKHLIYSTVA